MARLNNIELLPINMKVLPIFAHPDLCSTVWVRILLPLFDSLLSFWTFMALKNFLIESLIHPFAHDVNQGLGNHIAHPVLRVEKIA